MMKTISRILLICFASVSLLVFGQNCSKGFDVNNAEGGLELSSMDGFTKANGDEGLYSSYNLESVSMETGGEEPPSTFEDEYGNVVDGTQDDPNSSEEDVIGESGLTPASVGTPIPRPTPELPPATCSFLGRSIPSGGSVQAFANSVVPFGSGCQSQTRTCFNGQLSGSYGNSFCNVQPPKSCSFHGIVVAHGKSINAYETVLAVKGVCKTQRRLCDNGHLRGTYNHTFCR